MGNVFGNKFLFFSIFLLFSIPISQAASLQTGVPIFSDSAMQSCLNEAAALNGWTETEQVTALDCANSGVEFIDGIQVLTNLVSLKVADNRIDYLYPMEQLTQLEVLDLSNNRLMDVFSLQWLGNLKELYLSGNGRLELFAVNEVIASNSGITHLGVGGIDIEDLNTLPIFINPLIGGYDPYELVWLDVSNTGLTFDLAPLSSFPNLRYLNASGNAIEFSYPLEQLSQLEVLDLSENKLEDVASLATLGSIMELYLSGNASLDLVTVNSVIANNPGITNLGLGDIQVGNLYELPIFSSPLTGQPYNLAWLDVSNTGLELDLEPLWYFPNLHYLDASDNRISYPFPIDQLAQLEVLDLRNNRLTDVYPLDVLQNLKELYLSGNVSLDPVVVNNVIASNPNITHLGVGGVELGSLSALPIFNNVTTGQPYDLTWLDVSNTGLELDLGPLWSFPDLHYLDASNNRIEYLFPIDQLTQLEVLNLSDNLLTDVYPLMSLNSLKELYLSGNSGLDPSAVRDVISNNTGLTHLGIAQVQIGDLSTLPIFDSPTHGLSFELVWLDVSDTGLTLDLASLERFPNLYHLNASNNSIEYAFPLDQLSDLEVLDLSNNQLLDAAPLNALSNLTQLYLSGNGGVDLSSILDTLRNNPGLTHLGLGGLPIETVNFGSPLYADPLSTDPLDLVWLDVSGTGQVLDLNGLEDYPNLRYLNASNNQIEYPHPLDQLIQLEVLDLSNNQLMSVYPMLSLLKLKELNLSGNGALHSFSVLEVVDNNPRITHLGIGDIQFGDLGYLPGYQNNYEQSFDIAWLDVSNTGLAFDLNGLSVYPNLRYLDASDNLLNYPYPIDQLTHLEVVDLSNNELMEVFSLGLLTDIQTLDLPGNDGLQCHELDALITQLGADAVIRPLGCVLYTAPEIVIAPLWDGEVLVEGRPITFSADANDAEDGSLSDLIEWLSSIDGALGQGGDVQLSLSPGDHVITAQITDSDGNTTSESVNVNVIANSLPEIEIHSPSMGIVFQQSDVISFHAVASDLDDGNISQNVTWSSSLDGDLGTGDNLPVQLSAGIHVVAARVTDSSGATATATVEVSVNALPVLAISSPTEGDLFMLQEVAQFTASASDAEDGNLSGNIQWSSDIDGSLGSGSNISSALSLGTHVITASVSDGTGIEVVATRQITVDQIALAVTVGDRGNKKSATLSWSGSRTDVDVYLNGEIIGVEASEGQTTYKFKGRSAVFQVCEAGTNYCSVEITVP